MIERRKHKRFNVRENVLAVMPDIIGQIKNISEGGLAFRYIERDKDIQDTKEMDIFISNDEVYLEKIPIDTVQDQHKEHDSPFSIISIRQRGIKFGEMTDVQLSQLQYILRNYTLPES